jgi:iron-sulfur cluster repair protein YtfE (RIC family)
MTRHPQTPEPDAEPATNPLVQELERVHDLLRRDLRACHDLAESARAGAAPAELRGAVEQLATRSPHLRLGVDCLSFCSLVHRHHGGEDSVLFPLVRQNAPQLAPVVDRLEADHRLVSRLLDEVEAAVERLEQSDIPDATDQVVEALDDLSSHLLAHLTREEHALRPFLLSMDSWPEDERRSS